MPKGLQARTRTIATPITNALAATHFAPVGTRPIKAGPPGGCGQLTRSNVNTHKKVFRQVASQKFHLRCTYGLDVHSLVAHACLPLLIALAETQPETEQAMTHR